jgi:hypothetical protein
MYDTATKAQFIDLRARGWSYDKIARHTGISKPTLLKWGREFADDIENLKSDYISPRTAFPDGTAQESYFHNLPGESNQTSTPERVRRRRAKTNTSRPIVTKQKRGRVKADRLSRLRGKFRKLLKSPVVRAAIRYAVFKH